MRALAAALVLGLAPGEARALPEIFTDPLDGAFDLDRWLASAYGFVPVVAPVTEPAVGYGAAGGLLFLHGRPEEVADDTGPRRVRPGLSAAFGMGTSDGSWGAGAAHLGHWSGGDVRYLGAAMYASLELGSYVGEREVGFRLDSAATVQDLTFRVLGSDLSAGARYVFLGSRVAIEKGGDAVEPRDLETILSGLGPVLRWDGRDSMFSPSRGVRVDASATWFAPWLGSDRDGWKVRIEEVAYAPLLPWLVGALRLDLQLSGGSLPFWFRPYVALRGIPALRYQADHVFVAETEERVDLTRRWSAVLFGGVAATTSAVDTALAWNAGAGARYLLARQFGVRGGVDVARGPEEWAVYFVVGNAWR